MLARLSLTSLACCNVYNRMHILHSKKNQFHFFTIILQVDIGPFGKQAYDLYKIDNFYNEGIHIHIILEVPGKR